MVDEQTWMPLGHTVCHLNWQESAGGGEEGGSHCCWLGDVPEESRPARPGREIEQSG